MVAHRKYVMQFSGVQYEECGAKIIKLRVFFFFIELNF